MNDSADIYQGHIIDHDEISPELPFTTILLHAGNEPWLAVDVTSRRAGQKLITKYNNSVDDVSFLTEITRLKYRMREL